MWTRSGVGVLGLDLVEQIPHLGGREDPGHDQVSVLAELHVLAIEMSMLTTVRPAGRAVDGHNAPHVVRG